MNFTEKEIKNSIEMSNNLIETIVFYLDEADNYEEVVSYLKKYLPILTEEVLEDRARDYEDYEERFENEDLGFDPYLGCYTDDC